jgi:hypothetical protein
MGEIYMIIFLSIFIIYWHILKCLEYFKPDDDEKVKIL